MQSASSNTEKREVIGDLGKANSLERDGVGTTTIRDQEEMGEVAARSRTDKVGGCEIAE